MKLHPAGMILALALTFLNVTGSNIGSLFTILFGDSASELGLASAISKTNLLTSSVTFVCETWIFPIAPIMEERISFSDRFSSVYDDQFIHPIVLIYITGNEQTTTNFSYSTEFTESDILNTNMLGVRQRSPNCASIFINESKIETSVDITMSLIALKYGRPHKDYFVFIGKLDVIEEIYGANTQMADIRYKYAFESQATNSTVNNFKFWNICKQAGKKIALFERNCDSQLNGKHLLAVASSVEPFVHFGVNKFSQNTAGGSMASLFRETSVRLNFTFELRYSGFQGSSGFKKNGTWWGAVGEVFKREADVALTVATTVARFPMHDPSVNIVYIARYFYVRTPPYRMSWISIFRPLTCSLWILTGAALLFVVIPSYYLCALVYYNSYAPITSRNYIFMNLIDAIWRIFMEQSDAFRVWRCMRMRLLLFTWAFSSLIITTGYRSKLINFLTFLDQDDVPLTHSDLSLSDYELFFRTVGGGVAYQYTVNSPDPMHKRIMRRAVLVGTSKESLFKTLFAEKGAWLDYRINAEFAMDRYATLNPNLKVNPLFLRSRDSYFFCHIVLSFRKGSPWVESFDRVIGGILGAGLFDYYKSVEGYHSRVEGARWLRENNDTRIRDHIENFMQVLDLGPKPLNLSALFALFLILISGVTIGAVSWIGENVFYRGSTLSSLVSRVFERVRG